MFLTRTDVPDCNARHVKLHSRPRLVQRLTKGWVCYVMCDCFLHLKADSSRTNTHVGGSSLVGLCKYPLNKTTSPFLIQAWKAESRLRVTAHVSKQKKTQHAGFLSGVWFKGHAQSRQSKLLHDQYRQPLAECELNNVSVISSCIACTSRTQPTPSTRFLDFQSRLQQSQSYQRLGKALTEQHIERAYSKSGVGDSPQRST